MEETALAQLLLSDTDEESIRYKYVRSRMDYFFGEIVTAHGFAANQAGQYRAEDIVLGSFQFKNGIIGFISFFKISLLLSSSISKNEFRAPTVTFATGASTVVGDSPL